MQRDRRGKFVVPKKWKKAWSTLKLESQCVGDKEFHAFVANCLLDFGVSTPNIFPNPSREAQAFQEDIRHVSDLLFSLAADRAKPVHLDRLRLLQNLNWNERFEFRSRHEFPLDERLYQPIKTTRESLQRALSKVSKGYVAVLGTPGSGKSTLLTHFLRNWSGRVVRYYAYVPDSQDPTVLRGESVNFLHDVVLSLESFGFRAGETPNKFDRQLLLERFHKQMQMAHDDWRATGTKTIILVDGLDHIDREQSPEHSLINDLPLPEQVPDGVVMLVGSQTDSPLGARIQIEVQEPGRRVVMGPLSREAVFKIVDSANLRIKPSGHQRGEIFALSGAHPLALLYLLNLLREATGVEAVKVILNSAVAYSGSIEGYYQSYWKQLPDAYELVHLLGLLTRLRAVVDLRWVQQWANPQALHQLKLIFSHLFRRESADQWYFFHNSFRLFLLHKTAESAPGEFDPTKDQQLHRQLAEFCGLESDASPWRWEELYHLYQSSQHEQVLSRATQDYFRAQFLALRPTDAIKHDIFLALKSSLERRDAIALCRLVLSGTELEQREFHLSDVPYLDLLVNLGNKEILVQQIRDGNRLRVSSDTALSLVASMFRKGWVEEARRVFELAEPLDLLRSKKPIENDPQEGKSGSLETWAEVAPLIVPLDEILRRVRRVRVASDKFRKLTTTAASRRLRIEMLSNIYLTLLNADRWAELNEVELEWKREQPHDRGLWFWVQRSIWYRLKAQGRLDLAVRSFRRTLRKVNPKTATVSIRVAVAEFLLRECGDTNAARRFVKGIEQPPLSSDTRLSATGMGRFMYRFELIRIQCALASDTEVAHIIPLPSEFSDVGLAYFERAVCSVARIWGLAWRGKTLSATEVRRQCHPLVRFFARTREEVRNWSSWYVATGARAEFYPLVVRAVYQHGPSAVAALKETFDSEWADVASRRYWPSEVIRETVLALWRAGIEKEWSVGHLHALQEWMLNDQDVSGRIRESLDQAEAWLTLGESDLAKKSLQHLLSESMGVGYRKDYQTDEWIEWLGDINHSQPDLAPERLAWFARAIATLDETTEGRATGAASLELLEKAFAWSPVRSVTLRHWLLQHGLVSYEDSTASLLREAVDAAPGEYELVVECLTHLLLPISIGPDSDLTDSIVSAAATTGGERAAEKVSNDLLQAIEKYAMPSARDGWQIGVSNALTRIGVTNRVNLKAFSVPASTNSIDSRRLALTSGETLSPIEILQRVKFGAKLIDLMDAESDPPEFRWALVMRELVPKCSREDLLVLAGKLRDKSGDQEILALMAGRAAELGDETLAATFADKALGTSKSYGWAISFDGGSRLWGFRALEKVDQEKAAKSALETLVTDIASGGISFRLVAENLREIVPLLQQPVPIERLWPSIDNYVHALFAENFSTSVGAPDLAQTPSDDTAHAVLLKLISTALCHPVASIASGAQICLTKALVIGIPRANQIVQEALSRGEDSKLSVLISLDAATRVQPALATSLLSSLTPLCMSLHFGIRSIAVEIGARIGFRSSTNVPAIDLPAIYRLELPPDQIGVAVEDNPPEGGPLPDSNVPSEILRAFDVHVAAISEEAGIPELNIDYRIVQIMESLSPRVEWSADAEKRLRAHLSGVSLRFPFRRQRFLLARRAIFHCVGELVDAGVLQPQNLKRLAQVLSFYDPAFLLKEPVARPPEITAMVGISEYGTANDGWIDRLDEAIPSFCRALTDGTSVIGEQTQIKRLAWELPSERRECSTLMTSRSRIVGRAPILFGRVTNRKISEYVDLTVGRGSLIPALIRNVSYGFETPGENWLALNPAVGRMCGWELSGDGLFRWVGRDGKPVVESIWWVDGNLDHEPPHHSDEVGEGWVVVASQSAVETMVRQMGPLEKNMILSRSMRIKDEQRSKEIWKSEPIGI
jgi:hypothetical protein